MYKRITTNTLHEMKLKNEKISMLTAYDFTFARIVDEANVDVILVGDSASNVICLLYTSPSPRDLSTSRMPSSA